MSDQQVIIDDPLAPAMDYEYLMATGIEYINELNQTTWTNMNPSDPGITILDQLVYALTELGYCNGFPIADILTNINGKLDVENQFFLPDEILTSSPLTIYDYIKYLIDSVEKVKNASVFPMAHPSSNTRGALFTYLLGSELELTEQERVCLTNEANFSLNQARNIGESMVVPMVLLPVEFTLSGTVTLTNEASARIVADDIVKSINNFIFEPVQQEGYDSLVAQGYDSDTIFQGPRLTNGWIPNSSIVTKKNEVRLIDILNILNGIEGIKSVSKIEFCPLFQPKDIYGVSCENDVLTVPREVLPIYPSEQVRVCKGGLVFKRNGQVVDPDDESSQTLYESELKKLDLTEDLGATLDVLPDLPQGTWRDIEEYYSVQNTFPDIYGINSNAFGDAESEFTAANAKQLKGYLMVYDQLLANQFSQLANVHKLFSFSNSMYAYERGLYDLKQQPEQWFRDHTSFPSPYRSYLPTYFYQALYDVPNVQPLLKGNDRYNFQSEEKPTNVQLAEAWKKYKADPYNAYMAGLAHIVEDNETAETRRNRMLNHLLARHGVASIDTPLYQSNNFWSGNTKLNEILTKSILLQNYDLFSYNRMKGFDLMAADEIVDPNCIETGSCQETGEDSILYWEKLFLQEYEPEAETFVENGWLDTKALEASQKLTDQDFINYSAVELRMNLLLGITLYYKLLNQILCAYISNNKLYLLGQVVLEEQGNFDVLKLEDTEPSKDESVLTVRADANGKTNAEFMTDVARQLHWFSTQRQGFLFIENQLLFRYAGFDFTIIQGTLDDGILWVADQQLSYDIAMRFYDACFRQNAVGFAMEGDSLVVYYLQEQYSFTNGGYVDETGSPEKRDFKKVNVTGGDEFWIYGQALWSNLMSPAQAVIVPIESKLFNGRTEMIFPCYPQEFKNDHVRTRIREMATELVPAHIDNNVHFLSFEYLENTIIPAFIDWRNAIRFSDPNHVLDWNLFDNPVPIDTTEYCNENYSEITAAGAAAAFTLAQAIVEHFEYGVCDG